MKTEETEELGQKFLSDKNCWQHSWEDLDPEAQRERKPICCSEKPIKENQMLGVDIAWLKQIVPAAQSLGKHVVAGKPQTTSPHSTGTTLH